MATLARNSSYVTGRTRGRLTAASNAGGADAYIAKYTSSGIPLQITQLGTAQDDFATGIATDSSGNVYIVGNTSGGLSGTNAGNSDIFLAKFNSNLIQLWVQQLGTTAQDNGFAVTTNPSGGVYLTGNTLGGLSGTNAGGYDVVLAKYDSSGAQQWIRQFGTTQSDGATGVTTDSSGVVYITGITYGSLSGNNAGSLDVFLAKYDSSGVQQWIRQQGTSTDDIASGVVTDPSGNVSIAGYTSAGLEGNASAGFEDVFASQYNSSGTRLWTRQLGTASGDAANAIAEDQNGNLYLAGNTLGAFGGAANAGSNDILLLRLDSLTNVYK